jgi:argininosuccinate lyase
MIFTTSEFGLASLPQELTTGSSIMPQKRNPDVLELVRARYHVVLAEELKTRSLCANLMSGYNRDVQLTKEPLFAGIDATRACLEVMCLVLENVRFDEDRCRAALTDEMYATERVHALVLEGVPLREAYGIVARSGTGSIPGTY